MLLLNVGHVVHNRQSTLFACLARMIFMQRQRMKNLLLRARDVDRTSKIKISRRRLTEYVEIFHRKECRTCSTTTNQSIGLWRCRCRCRRHFLTPYSLITKTTPRRTTLKNNYSSTCDYFAITLSYSHPALLTKYALIRLVNTN